LEGSHEEPEDIDMNRKETDTQTRVLSVAQDPVHILRYGCDFWTSFNKAESNEAPEMTSVGYMPIIQAPAHELDTLDTLCCLEM